jgi:phosphoribosylaminoimidazole-succinocarboxamide synthase
MGAEQNLPHFHSGKVRDTKFIPGHPNLLLPITSDRFSTHNVKHKTLIPRKGEYLTALTLFWYLTLMQGEMSGIPNHIVGWGRQIYDYLPPGDYDPRLHYRAFVVKKLEMIPGEFIWRHFLTGSLWELYKQGLDPYGLGLPLGLPKMYRFELDCFTPTDKSETDVPLPAEQVSNEYPVATQATRRLFNRMTRFLDPLGITLVDFKAEVSIDGIVADEWGTGDCCRMTWTNKIKEGEDPPWLDKENGRQIAIQKWAGGPKVPLEFTDEEAKLILAGYETAFGAITQMDLEEFQWRYMN